MKYLWFNVNFFLSSVWYSIKILLWSLSKSERPEKIYNYFLFSNSKIIGYIRRMQKCLNLFKYADCISISRWFILIPVFSEYRYNKTVTNPCLNNPCSHLCVLIPGGFRCACPVSSVDGQSEMSCDATQERPRPSPLRCPCQNRGVCTDSGAGTVQCRCPADYEGNRLFLSFKFKELIWKQGKGSLEWIEYKWKRLEIHSTAW